MIYSNKKFILLILRHRLLVYVSKPYSDFQQTLLYLCRPYKPELP